MGGGSKLKKILQKNLKVVLGIGIISVLFSGCGPTVISVTALKPAQVTQMGDKNKIAVGELKGDDIGIGAKLEASMATKLVDNKQYFHVVSRTALDRVVSEQKLQGNSMMDPKTAARVGKLAGAQVLITGNVSSDATPGTYLEAREKCTSYYNNGKCASYQKYNVRCDTMKAKVSGVLNIVDIETASILHAENILKEYSDDTCKRKTFLGGLLTVGNTSGNELLTKEQAIERLSNIVVSEFTSKLAPYYAVFRVALIDDIEYKAATDRQKEQFENALGYIKNTRIEKANQILQKLHNDLNEQSYAVAYNLGITVESTGNFADALKLYKLADELLGKPNRYIDFAIKRVQTNIEDQKQANMQASKQAKL